MARGASFDVELEQRVGDAIGRELRAHGCNLFGGVCINLLRHPAWGRAQETYGEDPFLLGEMGAALVRGVQHHNVVATPKHFACNSMENARFSVDVRIDEGVLREVYLPHFKRCIDEGAGAVMSAYNKVNGDYCGHNAELLTRILKHEWGFDGYVYSDFVLGCRGPDACAAGLDVEAPDTIHYGEKLAAAVAAGEVELERIDDAVSRVLRSLFRVLAAPDPERYEATVIACPRHVALAREAATKSIVLLRNERVLPLAPESTRQLLVLGALADQENLGDHGSSRVFPPAVVTPLEGLRSGCPEGCRIVYDEGADLSRVSLLAADADVVLVVAGYSHRDEGEFIPGNTVDLEGDASFSIGGDRVDLTLGAEQEALIAAAADANPRTIVALMAGSAVLMEAWRERVAGILMLWYPGMEGGAALADVLFGRANPSGKLPFSLAKQSDDLPFFDRDADAIVYDRWHGYTKLERESIEPAFPFGFGLSYTSFALSAPAVVVDEARDVVEVRFEASNTGERDGATVAQVYGGRVDAGPDRPLKQLCGFTRLDLPAGGRASAQLQVRLRDLARWDGSERRWRLDAGRWRLSLGTSSAASELQHTLVELRERSWVV
jgi:beta-glucosidase